MNCENCRANGICDEIVGDCEQTDKIADKIYQQGAREFAEWLPQHFDLRFSNNPDVWLDEFFNHTRDKVLAEWQKGEENEPF